MPSDLQAILQMLETDLRRFKAALERDSYIDDPIYEVELRRRAVELANNWKNSQRAVLSSFVSSETLKLISRSFENLRKFAQGTYIRKRYDIELKAIRKELTKVEGLAHSAAVDLQPSVSHVRSGLGTSGAQEEMPHESQAAISNQGPVFISYARETTLSDWVRMLAGRLVGAGIHTILDQWDLQPADDLGRFMEQAIVKSRFVLIICTPAYAWKSNSSTGGVGFEGTIIKGALLTGAGNQGKFIPILRSGSPTEALPTFLWNRLFLDFTQDLDFENSLEKLIRHIYGSPLYVRPPLGPPPPYISPAMSMTTPKKWILVAGTGNQDRLPDEIESICSDLGKQLARGSFGLVTGGWPGVDRVVSSAFAEGLKEKGLALDNFLVQVVEQSWDPLFKAGRIEPVARGEAEYIESVKRADAAVLIGGLGGTYETGSYMRSAGKPVFPLVSTGGDAAKFFEFMVRNWYEGIIPGVSKEQFLSLDNEPRAALTNLARLMSHWAGYRPAR